MRGPFKFGGSDEGFAVVLRVGELGVEGAVTETTHQGVWAFIVHAGIFWILFNFVIFFSRKLGILLDVHMCVSHVVSQGKL